MPWGILIGGEELHNNHHAYGSSARLSNKWYEFDIGWLYIRVLEIVGLAQVRKVAPRIRIESGKAACDLQTLQAVITHRYDVVARFGRSLMATWKGELQVAQITRPDGRHVARSSAGCIGTPRILPRTSVPTWTRCSARAKCSPPSTPCVRSCQRLWARSTSSKEQLLQQLEDWCHRAEASGIASLQEFSRTLRGYAVPA